MTAVVISGAGRYADPWHDFAGTSAQLVTELTALGLTGEVATLGEAELPVGPVELLVVNALRFRPHPSHFNVGEALALIARVAPRRALITHVSHEIGRHAATTALLPRGVELAYDGLEIII